MGKKCTPSVAELKIINVLNGFEYLKYYMEVSFKGLKSGNSYYRFDFFIPKYNLIIEYDGACHNTKKSKESDNIKNNFCKKYNIKIFRFNKLHWRDLETHIIKLIVTKCPK